MAGREQLQAAGREMVRESVHRKLGTLNLALDHCSPQLHTVMEKFLAETKAGNQKRLYTIEGRAIEHGEINLLPMSNPVPNHKSLSRHRSCPLPDISSTADAGGSLPPLGNDRHGNRSGVTRQGHTKGHQRKKSADIPIIADTPISSRYGGVPKSIHDPLHDVAHNKYVAYTQGPDGFFPHPTDPSKKGLPFHRTADFGREGGLPDSHLKPLSNTSALHYNHFREHNDRYEHRQRELNFFVKAQHAHNHEMAALLNPTGNSQTKIYHMHATTKPLGRLHFDGHLPQFTFSPHCLKQLLPKGYERRQYDFWK